MKLIFSDGVIFPLDFKDLETGAHTNHIESVWCHAKYSHMAIIHCLLPWCPFVEGWRKSMVGDTSVMP